MPAPPLSTSTTTTSASQRQVTRPVILSSNITSRQFNSHHVGLQQMWSKFINIILLISFLFFYRAMAQVVHQVPQAQVVGLHPAADRLRKAIQSGRRDLNLSLPGLEGLRCRVLLAHRPVLMPTQVRGRRCIQVRHRACFSAALEFQLINSIFF